MDSDNEHLAPTRAGFNNTRWTLVLAAAERSMDASQNLERLCSLYWPPLYAYLRRQGHTPEDAKDLTQGFFVHLLAKDRLQQVAPAKGKFRSFLLACLNNYVQNERDKARAVKRGGGQVPLSINYFNAETHCAVDPPTTEDPARIFERRWAATLIEHVLGILEAEYTRRGKSKVFQVLHSFLTGDGQRGGYDHAAATLQISEGAARVAATRLRKDFSDLLRAEVGRTVGSPDEVDQELEFLLQAFQK